MYNHDKNSNSKYVLSHNSNGNIEFIEHPNVKWYQKENNARLLSQDFYKHVLILRIIYNIEGNEHVAFFTGSPLLYKDKYLWLSAGHVIKIIQEMVYNDSYKIRGMSWFDNYSLPLEESQLCIYVFRITSRTSRQENPNRCFTLIKYNQIIDLSS